MFDRSRPDRPLRIGGRTTTEQRLTGICVSTVTRQIIDLFSKDCQIPPARSGDWQSVLRPGGH